MKALTKKIPYFLTITFLFLSSFQSTAYAGTVEEKIDSWGTTASNILIKCARWGGIFAIIGIGLFLYINHDEAGAKRGKIAFVIVIIATFLAWFAPIIVDQFTGSGAVAK